MGLLILNALRYLVFGSAQPLFAGRRERQRTAHRTLPGRQSASRVPHERYDFSYTGVMSPRHRPRSTKMSFPPPPVEKSASEYAREAEQAEAEYEARCLVEFRAYRAGAASRHVLVIFEIESKKAFSEFWEFLQKEKILDEVYANTVDAVSELWGPSPLIPEPLRP